MSAPIPPKTPIEPRRTDHMGEYFKAHSREILAYVLLILGILLLFYNPILGGVIVGLIAGIYFGKEIVDYILHWKAGIYTPRVARQIILAGVALAFFICAPAIFLGAAIAIALQQLFIGSNTH